MKIIKLHTETDSPLLVQAGLFLSNHLSNLYPGFDGWFNHKVVGSSDAIVLIAVENNHLAGVSIGKIGAEAKLRCVRVREDLQGSGLGIRFIDTMIENLQCEKPHCTVAEEMMHDYSRAFMKRYGFSLSEVTKGQYRSRKLEYHWN